MSLSSLSSIRFSSFQYAVFDFENEDDDEDEDESKAEQ